MAALKRAVTIGTFDGVHLGHQRLLETLVAVSKRRRLAPMVALFPYSPGLFFKGQEAIVKLITTVDERIAFIRARFNIRHFKVLPMTREFFSITADEFLARCVHGEWNAQMLLAGRNFGIGKDRALHAGNVRVMAKRWGIEAKVVPLVRRLTPVSSTRIRGALAEGDFSLAAKLLGRPFDLRGRVVRGSGIASTQLGYPTANLAVDSSKLLPLGVFRARIKELNRWAALNIGFRPTIEEASVKPEEKKPVVEAYVVGFHGNLYGRHLTLEIYEKLRGEKRFGSLEELKNQISKDIERISRLGEPPFFS